jgi:hypothetical protein
MAVVEMITVPQAVDRPRAPSNLRRVAPSALVVLGYLVIGSVAFWPVYPISHRLFSPYQDYTESLWFIDWWPHALAHGLNPFFSNALFVPTGINLAQNTSSPLLGLVATPFAVVFSPVVIMNVLMVLAMPVSAAAAFVVLRKWQIWLPAAALGGLIYGFSPYMVSQGLAHLVLTFVPLPPFIASTVVSILLRQGSARRLGIRLGLLVAAQFLISPEVLASVAIFTLAGVACASIRHRTQVLETARAVWAPVTVALVVGCALLAYPVWMMLAGPQHFTGTDLNTTNPFHNDLLSFVLPGPLQKVSLGLGSLGTRLTAGGDAVEAGAYIGIPLLILTGILAWRSRRSGRMQLTLVLLLGAALLSLGPHLTVDGRSSHIPLPFWLLDHIPLLDDLLPSRMGFEMGALLAAAIAFGLDDVHRETTVDRRASGSRLPRLRRWEGAVFVGVTLAVLVATQLPQWPPRSSSVGTPADGLPAAIRRAVPTGNPVTITYPYETQFGMQPMLWQAEDGFGFRLLGGYGYHRAPSGRGSILPDVMEPRGMQQFLTEQDTNSAVGLGGLYGPPLPVDPELVAATRATLSKYDVRLVIVDRSEVGSGPVMELFDDSLGPPKVSAGQYSLWAGWHGVPKHQVFQDPVLTLMYLPSNGARLSGTTKLYAYVVDDLHVTHANFVLTDGTNHSMPIPAVESSPNLWTTTWDTAAVANGIYTLRSDVCDTGNRCGHSPGVTITIKNHGRPSTAPSPAPVGST